MEKKYSKNSKFKAFLKRNMYYIIMGVCIVAIGAMITVAVIAQKGGDPNPNQQGPDEPAIVDPVDKDPNGGGNQDPDDPVINPEPIIFALPVASNDIILDFEEVFYSSTLKVGRAHNGIDFKGEEGDIVVAAYAGEVVKVSYDILNGGMVEIKHEDGLLTRYCSLQEESIVAVGQKVAKGETIGKMSDSATSESEYGPHLHFMVFKDSKLVNPNDYLPSGDK